MKLLRRERRLQVDRDRHPPWFTSSPTPRLSVRMIGPDIPKCVNSISPNSLATTRLLRAPCDASGVGAVTRAQLRLDILQRQPLQVFDPLLLAHQRRERRLRRHDRVPQLARHRRSRRRSSRSSDTMRRPSRSRPRPRPSVRRTRSPLLRARPAPRPTSPWSRVARARRDRSPTLDRVGHVAGPVALGEHAPSALDFRLHAHLAQQVDQLIPEEPRERAVEELAVRGRTPR